MRPKLIPKSEDSAVRVIVVFAIACALLVLLIVVTSCSPRAFQEVNKLAPEPPYAGQRHSGLDRAQYLRDTEPFDYE